MRPFFNRLATAFRSLYSFDHPGCQVRLSIRQHLPIFAFPILLLWYLVRPSPVAATGAAALGGLLLLCYLWGHSMAKSMSGERHLHYTALQVGDELEEQVILNNNSALPALWVEFIDHSNLPGYTFSSVRSTGGHSITEWRTNTICTRRGVFTLGPWEMRCSDPFGLFLMQQTWLQKNEILVYPPLAPLPARLLPHGDVQGEERPLHQPLRAETQDAFTACPERVRSLTARLAASAANPYEVAMRIQNYLRITYAYTLNVPPAPRAVDSARQVWIHSFWEWLRLVFSKKEKQG